VPVVPPAAAAAGRRAAAPLRGLVRPLRREAGRSAPAVRRGLQAVGRDARRGSVVLRNVFDLVVRDAVRNWARHPRTLTPALGTMTMLLLLAGIGFLSGLAVHNVVQQEAAQASFLNLYLRDSATQQQVGRLAGRLRADRRVLSVRYVSKQEALQQVRSRPGLRSLIQDTSDNPLPASFQVDLRGLSDVGPVARAYSSDPAVDPSYPTSYQADVYQNLQTFVRVAGAIVVVVLAALALVAAMVTANTIRAGIVARSDDVTIMRLVGAGGWTLRGPFVIEGALTGAAAGLLGAALLVGIFAGAQRVSSALFTQLLPGVGWQAVVVCGLLLLAVGVALGSTASLAGLRGLRA
jgi:cell division transport system permease protein